MEYFTKLIEKIEDIEDNFNIINSRIIEFWESTDYKYIDFWLVNKYYDILKKYIEFLKFEKDFLDKDENNDIEYKSAKKLMKIRLSEMIDKINIILSKVEKIVKIKKIDLNKDQIKESFESSEQMENIEKLLIDFKKELRIYRKIQRDLWIKIDLDDKIEKDIEENNSREDIIIIQKEFIEDMSDFLEEILRSKDIRFKEILGREDILFKKIVEKDIYEEYFFKIFDKEYIVPLKIEWTKLYNDSILFDKLNKDIDLILDIWTFCNDFELNLVTSRMYGLEDLILKFSSIKDELQKTVLDRKDFELNKLISEIETKFSKEKLEALFDLFDSFWDLVEVYKSLGSIDFDYVNHYYSSGFVRFFKETESLENIVSKIIRNNNKKILEYFKKYNINFNNLLEKRENIQEEYWIKMKSFLSIEKDLLDKLYKWLLSSNTDIKVYYYPRTLKSLKLQISDNISSFSWEEFYEELIAYYNEVAKKLYRISKQRYYSDRWGWGWYSSWGGYSSWGWWWSSSSSSWSSSYSSSWSSSW